MKPQPTPVEFTPVELLRQARDLIASPDHWTQGTRYRSVLDNDGTTRHVSYCSIGAIEQAASTMTAHTKWSTYHEFENYTRVRDDARIALVTAIRGRPPGPSSVFNTQNTIVVFNDKGNTTHKKVVNAFTRAIKRAETEELTHQLDKIT